MNSHVKQYQQLDVSTAIDEASPHQLIDMLFRGANDRILQALGSLERDDMAGKARAINACIDILSGLQASLDHEQGGDLAGNLESLYDYMQRRLFRATSDNDAAALREVADLLSTLRSAWVQIDPAASVSAG
ncbi:MAG: flagellar export chaperone FliS [Pseudomonadota bacterium]